MVILFINTNAIDCWKSHKLTYSFSEQNEQLTEKDILIAFHVI